MKDIKTIIKEEIQNIKESQELLGIPELAEFLTRVDPENFPQDMMVEMLQQVYQNGGDEAIVNYMKKEAGVVLQILGRGKYAIKY